jgi:hypothetical protein
MAKVKWAIQPCKHKKTFIDSQSVYAWLILIIGFVFIILTPYESAGGIIARASGTALILVGLVWGFIIGLQRWWSH